MRGYGLGFGVVLALVGLALDYDDVSRRAGVGFGSLAVQNYAATIPARITAYRAQAAATQALTARQGTAPAMHLGPAPAGWDRLDWTPEVAAWLNGMTPEDYAAWQAHLTRNDSPLTRPKPLSATEIRRKQQTAVIYRRDPEVIEVTATWQPVPDAPRGVAAQVTAMARMALNEQVEAGFAFVDGVAYVVPAHASGAAAPFRTLHARIGPQVTLTLRARASDAAIRAVLDQIDHGALNAMLDQPLADVGDHQPTLTVEGQMRLADLYIAAENAREAALAKAHQDTVANATALNMLTIKGPQPLTDITADPTLRAEIARQTLAGTAVQPAAAALPPEPAPPAPVSAAPVKINRIAGDTALPGTHIVQQRGVTATCRIDNGVKRCRIGD